MARCELLATMSGRLDADGLRMRYGRAVRALVRELDRRRVVVVVVVAGS